MDSTRLSANINVLINACQKISRFILRDFGEIEQLQSSVKGARNFAMASKNKIEAVLKDTLLEARPKYCYLSNSEDIKGSDISHRFIVNVSDGFDNYSRSIPFFTISIAIQEQKELIASIIYSPVLDKMYYAEKGSGTYVSESRMIRRLRVSSNKELFDAVVIEDGGFKNFKKSRILNLGSVGLGLSYIASGIGDIFVGFNKNVFDLAAGLLIVKEAGGIIKAFDKDLKETSDIFHSEIIACSNSYLQSEIKSCILLK